MKKLFSNNVEVFFCDELANQNSKVVPVSRMEVKNTKIKTQTPNITYLF
jgi:hypothetical protein